ncbi:MAG: hypothetical protein ACK5NK_00770 [Niabella sp.]
MKIIVRLKVITILCFVYTLTSAQGKKEIKFGKVTTADFSIPNPVIDSNVNAVVLADVGISKIEGNNKGWFSLIYTHTKRVKILNKKAFDIADVSIPLYSAAMGEKKS